MYRIELDVPFSDKEDAKSLGARWDSGNKTWYAPAGVDAEKLKRWIAPFRVGQLRAPSFHILSTMCECWKCGKGTKVHALCLPIDHERCELVEAVENMPTGRWIAPKTTAMLSYVEEVSETVKAAIEGVSKQYRLDYSKQKAKWYWMNHCSHCGIKIGDHGLHGEPGNPFFFLTPEQGLGVLVRRQSIGFAGIAFDGWWSFLDHFINALDEAKKLALQRGVAG